MSLGTTVILVSDIESVNVRFIVIVDLLRHVG